MAKIWFITGSSRGLGRSLTEEVLLNGDMVAATARNIESLSDLVAKYQGAIFPIELDVTNKHQVKKAVTETVAQFGRIDVLVNNAGFGITGAIEAFSNDQVRSQLETNLYAPIEITRAVLPYMRKQRSGHILQISSMGGRVGSGGVSIYQAAKFGLSGFSEGLALEVVDFGINVTCVEPGGFRTDWAGDSMTFATEIEGYDMVNNRIQLFKNGGFKAIGDPAKAAKVIREITNHSEPPLHLLLGSEAVAIVRQSEAAKLCELESWEKVSLSTDSDDAENFLESEAGKRFMNLKK